MRRTVFLLIIVFFWGCQPPPVENVYRKESRFQGGLNVPVAFLVNEWASKPKILASGWLIEDSPGVLFSARHFIDAFMGDVVELGGSECKAFMNGRVYDCLVVQVPALRDAVVLKLKGFSDINQLTKPYKIATEKVKIGETLFVQGFHPHPSEVTRSNAKDGFNDFLVPILKDFYELRVADHFLKREVVFDNLKTRVVSINERLRIATDDYDPLGDIRFRANEFIKVITVRNHKFSFGGLSGGVALRFNSKGEAEAVGIVTAERPVRFEYDKKGQLMNKAEPRAVSDTILITPIHSVKDLYEYAKTLR